MPRFDLLFVGFATVTFLVSSTAAAQASGGITVLSGQFGTLGDNRKLDIGATLQQLCGSGGESCEAFCSETSFGLYRLGRKPICRVTYRCPDGTTRAVEAAREEPILMRCETEEQPALVPGQDQLQPPPYVPPSGR